MIIKFLKSLNHWKLLLSGLFIVLLFLIISVYFDLFNEKYVNKTIQLFPAIIALIALAISISLYDKFGMKKYIYEKKIKVALEILEILKTDLNIFVVIIRKDKNAQILEFKIIEDFNNKEKLNDLYNYPLIFVYKEYREIFQKLYESSESIYLNKDTADKLKIIKTPFYKKKYSEFAEQNPNYIILGRDIFVDEESYIMYLPDGFTLKSYVEEIYDTIKEIESWLESQTKIKGLLNL